MFLFCVLSDLMYLCDCIGIRRTVNTGCYVIADSSTYFADAVAYGKFFNRTVRIYFWLIPCVFLNNIEYIFQDDIEYISE